MEGIKKIKILETGGGKEDNIFNFSLAEFPQGKNIISSPLFYILFSHMKNLWKMKILCG